MPSWVLVKLCLPNTFKFSDRFFLEGFYQVEIYWFLGQYWEQSIYVLVPVISWSYLGNAQVILPWGRIDNVINSVIFPWLDIRTTGNIFSNLHSFLTIFPLSPNIVSFEIVSEKTKSCWDYAVIFLAQFGGQIKGPFHLSPKGFLFLSFFITKLISDSEIYMLKL